MERIQALDQHKGFCGGGMVQMGGSTAGSLTGAHFEPVRTHRHLGAQSGVASGIDAEAACGGFRMQEALQQAVADQA